METTRRRQATACDWCRSHKLKCDAELPSCRNCARRGIPCVTVNLRLPGAEGRRQAPVGRRRRRSTLPPLTPDPSPGTRADISMASGPRSPPPLPLPTAFAACSPDKLMPGLFAAPFDDSAADEVHLPMDAALSQSSPSSAKPPGPDAIVTLVTDKSCFRRQAISSGSSQYVLVQWLDLFFSQCPTWTPVFPLIRQGLAYSAEVSLPLSLSPHADLPSPEMTHKYADVFFARIYPVFPVVDRASWEQAVADLRPKLGCLGPRDYPQLAGVYAVCSAAADEEAGGLSAAGTLYLQAAYGLYGHLVAMPYAASVQALLLLTLLLRMRNKDGAAWGCLGQAVRMAQSMGLHRHVPSSSQDGEDDDADGLHARIWWTAYVLERAMELETGRPSAVRDADCDQVVPRTASACSFDYFRALVGLARIKTRAIDLLYGSSRHTRKPVRALLFEMGQIDRAMLDWADGFPESIRPGRDLFCDASELHLATRVSLDYHQTMIALHRPALVSATGFLRNRINEYCAGTPWRARLHFSLCIGVASARAILKALNDLLMYAGPSRLITANQVFLAVLVLAIYVTKVPMSRMNSADVAMLQTFAEQIADEFAALGQDAEFSKGIRLLRSQMGDYFASLRASQVAGSRESSVLPHMDAALEETSDSAHLASLEASWSHLWNEDLSAILANPGEDWTSMYLLGIPESWS